MAGCRCGPAVASVGLGQSVPGLALFLGAAGGAVDPRPDLCLDWYPNCVRSGGGSIEIKPLLGWLVFRLVPLAEPTRSLPPYEPPFKMRTRDFFLFFVLFWDFETGDGHRTGNLSRAQAASRMGGGPEPPGHLRRQLTRWLFKY